MNLSTFKERIKDYFKLTPYLEDEATARQTIMDGIDFHGPNIIILIIAIIIASLGLNTNSAPVVIGAMLISPLMGPIIGIGLGVGTYNYPLVKRATRNLAAAALFSVLASTIFFLISPVSEGRSELLARTSPTIYDVLIGFFGGGAGIVAIACKQKGNVIPGVAIATALMPPLCTAGYGLATWQLNYFTGAFYLFLINSIFIALATLIGVKLFKFQPYKFVDENRKRRVKRVLLTVVICTLLPSIYLTAQMLQESYFVNEANTFISEELDLPNTQVFNKDVYTQRWKKYINVTLIGQQVNIDSLQAALTNKMDHSGTLLAGTHLTIKQGFTMGIDRGGALSGDNLRDAFTSAFDQMSRQRTTIDSLNNVIRHTQSLDSLSYTVAPEIHVLYPDIQYIALSQSMICNTETRRLDTLNIAVIEHTGRLKDTGVIKKYLETRTGLSNIHLIDTEININAKMDSMKP